MTDQWCRSVFHVTNQSSWDGHVKCCLPLTWQTIHDLWDSKRKTREEHRGRLTQWGREDSDTLSHNSSFSSRLPFQIQRAAVVEMGIICKSVVFCGSNFNQWGSCCLRTLSLRFLEASGQLLLEEGCQPRWTFALLPVPVLLVKGLPFHDFHVTMQLTSIPGQSWKNPRYAAHLVPRNVREVFHFGWRINIQRN